MMFPIPIAECRRNFSARTGPAARPGRRATRLVALLWMAAVPAGISRAQNGGAVPPPIPTGGSDIQVTVRDVAASSRLINVPVNKSVLVDFSQPVREVRVAKSDVAEVTPISPKQILLTGKSFGTTQLIVWINENEQKVFDLAVDLELDRLQASIRSTVPRASVKAHSVMDTVVLTGTAPDTESAQRILEIANVYSKQVVNQLRVAGVQQVLLRCTVAEVNRRIVKQLGFNGWIAGDNVRDMFAVQQLDGINPANIGAAGSANVLGAIPFLTDRTGIPLTERPALSFGFPRVQMQIFIQALRENGLLRVLAEPNLVTISGQEANFLAGGEFPIPVPQGQNQAITITYKEFGVRLRFTPAVLSENLIRVQVAPEISEPDYSNAVTLSGYVVPGLTQRRVQTVVELGPGQTFAIGGLLSERVRGVSRKIPGLGEIPVLGALFSSVQYQSDESELVVLVTPELVEPLSPDQIARVPGADMVPPNDFELYLLGNLEGKPSGGAPALKPRVNNEWPVRPSELYGASSTMKVRGPVGPAGGEEGP